MLTKPLLTKKQQDVLAFILQYIGLKKYPPSTREIQEWFQFASQTASQNHLKALKRKGVIDWIPGKARTISVL